MLCIFNTLKRSELKYLIDVGSQATKLNFLKSFLSVELNFCHSSPCKNEGTCTPKTDGFECDCKQGYFGKTCEGK